MMKKRLVSTILLLVFVFSVFAFTPVKAQVADNVESLEMLYAVNTPTAGVLKKGQYQVDLRTFGAGGATAAIGVGLFDRFMFGVSFGGDKLIGYEDPEWNELPGMVARYRIIEESVTLPAITIGFDMQGRGPWSEDAKRYLFKSPGMFAAATRNFVSDYGNFGIHGGVNYNTFEDDDESSLDFFAGIDFAINEQFAIVAEYDMALDDNEEESPVDIYGTGKGYLNLSARFTFAQAMVLEVIFSDILENSGNTDGMGRELRLTYVETFTF